MLKPADNISVIITSYNWSQAIAAVLSALDNQTDRQFEVWLADDGSCCDALSAIKAAMSRVNYATHLITQQDCGFRAAKIRNQAAAQASGRYLIFLDGDCLPFPDYIARHRQLAESGFWVAGNRILLNQRLTNQTLQHVVQQNWQPAGKKYWWLQRLLGNVNRGLPLLHWPLAWGRKRYPTQWKGAKTCNLGVWKNDFLVVNGFDEQYQGWGYEDSDFVIRLIRSDVFRKSGRFALPVLHLWHPQQDRCTTSNNLARLQAIIASDNHRALLGVDQY